LLYTLLISGWTTWYSPTKVGRIDEDGISPSWLVAEWLHTKIIQEKLIPEIGEQDPNALSWAKVYTCNMCGFRTLHYTITISHAKNIQTRKPYATKFWKSLQVGWRKIST
jgi:hypothetical protein